MCDERAPLRPELIARLRKDLSGVVIEPQSGEYHHVRRVWNAAIDNFPCAIVKCADAEDVTRTVRFAADNEIALTVRGGGHNAAGRAVANGALMLDLSSMRAVSIDTKTLTARVQGGATWHDVDVATAEYGMATTGGLVSGTGVGGLTLGGGAGWLMRKYGLACDNLRDAHVVLADGRFVRAAAEENPDLLWGLRGGGGGLGVVTDFTFRLHQQRQVLAGLIIRPAADTKLVLQTFREFVAQAPDDFCGLTAIAHAPALPFLRASWYGMPVVISVVCWAGDLNAGPQVLKPLREFGTVLADHIGPIDYVQWQHLQDSSTPTGRYQYWKTANFEVLSDSVIDRLADASLDLPTMQTEIHVQHMGGAVARIPSADTAFGLRNARFFINLIGTAIWQSQFSQLREGIRRFHSQISPEAMPALLPNFSNQDDGDVELSPGNQNAGRLAALRQRFDPSSRLRGRG